MPLCELSCKPGCPALDYRNGKAKDQLRHQKPGLFAICIWGCRVSTWSEIRMFGPSKRSECHESHSFRDARVRGECRFPTIHRVSWEGNAWNSPFFPETKQVRSNPGRCSPGSHHQDWCYRRRCWTGSSILNLKATCEIPTGVSVLQSPGRQPIIHSKLYLTRAHLSVGKTKMESCEHSHCAPTAP